MAVNLYFVYVSMFLVSFFIVTAYTNIVIFCIFVLHFLYAVSCTAIHLQPKAPKHRHLGVFLCLKNIL